MSTTTVRKWIRRYEAEGRADMADRSSRPQRMPSQIAISLAATIDVLRCQRLSGRQIAERVGLSKATVHRVLRRHRLQRLSAIDPPAPAARCEHDRPGALLHLDIKKLGCIDRVGHRMHGNRRSGVLGIGWEFVHVALDDHSRLVFSRVLADQRHTPAIAFLLAAIAYYRSFGIPISAIFTDNGSCYRSQAFRQTCSQLGLKHRFTRPYRPRINGKAERFIQTLLREWAYAAAYDNSAQRNAQLPA